MADSKDFSNLPDRNIIMADMPYCHVVKDESTGNPTLINAGNCNKCYRLGKVGDTCLHGHAEKGNFVEFYFILGTSTLFFNPGFLALLFVLPDENDTVILSSENAVANNVKKSGYIPPWVSIFTHEMAAEAQSHETLLTDLLTRDIVTPEGVAQHTELQSVGFLRGFLVRPK